MNEAGTKANAGLEKASKDDRAEKGAKEVVGETVMQVDASLQLAAKGDVNEVQRKTMLVSGLRNRARRHIRATTSLRML